ncbi:Ser-tRNA(Ala) deacylase AlaX [Serratia fonticola]|uniref:Ser-tRNA(Ala) deacylase AlaX n=1 Tax=Serratia fonticola TaxID=47917 RepID=A0A559T9G4_SERFO|nr:alanyl-tRNA editing protein [Serratia fonticola]TQI81217.1 Ser-tRNA(Ala) deacylase AlaX [Serratia fonticola]TQI96759.1 Ser-tRNA(Ala) deacylase AlaX [Serratia fonticola]TVZ71255.1 Ser-tRNA(Ala) deacylase AlaX [Serratia fonticola]
MTERRYYYSDDLQQQAQVLACTAAEDGSYAVQLDSTLFHPQGGGQPADKGTLDGRAVLRVAVQGEQIVHYLAEPVPCGPVTMTVDASSRHLHTRLHSAGHLIGGLGESQGWQPVKAHHWPGEGRITFAPGAQAKVLEQTYLQNELNKLIAADLPRNQQQLQGIRQVGFGDLPAYGCGGTHVRSLAALGNVQITNVKMKKGQLIVQYEVV